MEWNRRDLNGYGVVTCQIPEEVRKLFRHVQNVSKGEEFCNGVFWMNTKIMEKKVSHFLDKKSFHPKSSLGIFFDSVRGYDNFECIFWKRVWKVVRVSGGGGGSHWGW